MPPRSDLPLSIGGKGTNSLAAEKRVTGWGNDIIKKKNKKEDVVVKLNTVEKSKEDWSALVEREGIREELEKAEKSAGSYLGRQEFLKRLEAERERERVRG